MVRRKKKIRRAYQTPHRVSARVAITSQLFNLHKRSSWTSATVPILLKVKISTFLTMAMMNHNYSKYRRRSKKSLPKLS